MNRRLTFATLCLAALGAAPAAAQQPAPLRLVPTGRAFARGDGDVVRCLVRDDSANMLTVGAAGDLVWWDLRKRRPLRWIPPLDEPILAVQLHPSEPLVVCRLGGRTARRVDLESGGVSTLTAEQADALAAPGWLTGAKGSKDDVVSRDGQRRLVMKNGVRRRVPSVAGPFLYGSAECWLANDGTAIEAPPGGLRLTGLTFSDRADFHLHCAAPQQLCFTPDGGHLALLRHTATQVVDVAGQEIAHFEGTHLVRPGPQPDEFWLLTETAMQRWSAGQCARVGDPVVWPGHYIRMFDEGIFGHRLNRLRTVLVHGGQPWTQEAARRPDGTFRSLDLMRPPTPQEPLPLVGILSGPAIAFDNGDGTREPLLLTSYPGDAKIPGHASLWRFDDAGNTTQSLGFSPAALWLNRTADGARAWVGMSDGSLHAVDAERLTTAKTVKFEPPLIAAVMLDATHLLATTGNKLLRVDATTLAVVDEVPLPQGLRGVDQLVSSADGKRLAIVRGCAVWLLQVQ